MKGHTRRAFLERIGTGAIAAAIGAGFANELGACGGRAVAGEARLSFGALDPLADLMQRTPADALLPKLKAALDGGTTLETLVAAAALANARTHGGHDYTGYHCFMALVPALEMSRRLPASRAALPVFKVLHRNTQRMQERDGGRQEALKPLPPPTPIAPETPQRLLSASRGADLDLPRAEAALTSLVANQPQEAFEALQPIVRDNIDVHQIVLTFRAWDMLRLTGEAHADVMLRQTLRQCLDRERSRVKRGAAAPSIRSLGPTLMASHGLARAGDTVRSLSDDEIHALATVVFTKGRDETAAHVAALLGEGASPTDVGEALALASAWLLLHDPGKPRAQPGKPVGSVHGASVGVHAADAAQAWRGIARAGSVAVRNASLVAGAWHTAGQSGGMDRAAPVHDASREAAAKVPRDQLLGALDEAVRGRDQAAAAALAERYGATGGDADRLIDLLLGPAIDHDGALHHEKYFLTATEAFTTSRPAHRWVHLVSLARVMASGYGFEAPGVAASKALLGAG